MITWFLRQFPSLQSLQDRFNSLSRRERGLVGVLLVVLLGLLIIYGALLPAKEMRDTSIRNLTATQLAVEWMRNNRAEAQRKAGSLPSSSGENRLSVISRSSQLYGLSIRRMQPRDETIDVELLEQDANSLLSWLATLETEHGVQVVSVRIDKFDEGQVNCRLTVR